MKQNTHTIEIKPGKYKPRSMLAASKRILAISKKIIASAPLV
jgi:hypothetical protein